MMLLRAMGLAYLAGFSSLLAAKTVFSPYADLTINTHWSAEHQALVPMDLDTIGAKHHLKSYHLAFITDASNCQPAWGGQAGFSIKDNWAKPLAQSLAKQGIETVVSFGGATGNDVSLHCSEAALVTIFQQTVTTYQAKGLDFDIENGSTNLPKLISSLQQFQKKDSKTRLSFTLPVMPEGLTPAGKEVVEQAVKAGLRFNVNIMAMDYGPSYNGDMGKYAIQAATALHAHLKTLYPGKSDAEVWQTIEVTPMIGVNDVSVEQFTLQNGQALKEFAIANQLGALAIWSVARDKPCADRAASPICSGNNLQKTEGEFMKTMNIVPVPGL